MSTEPLLEINDLTIRFGGGIGRGEPFTALENLDLCIPADTPQIIAIAGESGSGKTTLGRAVLGMTHPSEGTVRFEGKDVWSAKRVRTKDFRRKVQAVFQDPFSVFNPFYPVEHVMRAPLECFGIEKNRTRQMDHIEAALEKVGLKPDQIVGRHPHQLSGGQRQRIVVARALMLKPKLIVADEPVSMIDASLRATVLQNLKALRDEHGISILYITHDLATARQVSDRLFVLYRGRAVETGSADDVIGNPKHPYTQLLMNSIPRPDPDTPWPGEEIGADETGASGRSACVFVDRCPRRMSVCHRRPAQIGLESGRTVECHLYDPAAQLAS